MHIDTELHPIEARVRQAVADYGRLNGRGAGLTSDASLAEAGLSSLATVDVMLALEAEFGEFPDRMMNGRVFSSIGSIAAALQELLGG